MEFDRRKRPGSRVAMAPMIDVVFLLLIFFLLSSEFVSRRAVGLQLPASDSSVAVRQAPVTVSVGPGQALAIAGTQVSPANLEGVLKGMLQADPEKRVRIDADASVTVQRLVRVLDEVRRAGAERVDLEARPRDPQP